MGGYSKPDLDSMLLSKDIEEVTKALLYITFNVDELDWVQARCLDMVNHKNIDVSGLAITCIGHIARIHAKIDKEKVFPVLREKLGDNRLSGRVQDALDDIEMFTL